ncbi:MAG TPA: GHKL domain-containing protein [Clostridiales bacterium]|nr:GHKL domain-containing protein [Clostridiales bacterium]
MPQYLAIFCFFISDFIQIMFEGAAIITVLNRKSSITRLAMFGLINALTISIPFLINNTQYFFLMRIAIFAITMILTMKLILHLDILTSVISLIFIIIINTIAEYICMVILKLCLTEGFLTDLMKQVTIFDFILKSILCLMVVIVTAIIYYFKNIIAIPENIKITRMIGLALNFIIMFMLIAPNMLFILNNFGNIKLGLIVYNLILLFLLTLINVYNSKKFAELEMQKQKIDFQNQYIDTLSEAVDGLRSFKHEFNNLVNVIGGYIALDDFNGLKKYFEQLKSKCTKINNIFPLNSYAKNDPAIYGLLLSKISTAEIKDINFNVNLTTELYSKAMKSFDLYKILGILLDNAFEAAERSEMKYVEFFTRKLDNDGNLLLEIKNSFSGNIDVNMIYTNGYSTKSGHSGFGLWEVRKTISRYKNFSINTMVNHNIFTQQIKLY